MSQKKIIVVFGATGAQGGGLARAILNDSNSEFAVRAVTRDINSDKAKELAAMGAEVVAGDVDDMESMKARISKVPTELILSHFSGRIFLRKKKWPKQRIWQPRQKKPV